MRWRRGLSLLELILSFSLMLLLCIFVLDLLPGSLLAMKRSEARLDGQRLAESILESAKTANFQSLVVGRTTVYPSKELNRVNFSSELLVEAVPGYPSTALKSLKATVTWKDHNRDKIVRESVWVWNGQ